MVEVLARSMRRGALLEALRATGAPGMDDIKLFHRVNVAVPDVPGFAPRSIGFATLLEGTVPSGMKVLPSMSQPETHLFKGLKTALVHRNGETLQIARCWLQHHVTHHGLEAALILDRAQPQNTLGPALHADLARAPIKGLKRVVVLNCPDPLGADDAPEADPIHAPDAPGKDQMARPAADPWSSPLAQPAVFEAVRWRFLQEAAAVVCLEMTDILLPRRQSVFDAAFSSPKGIYAFKGYRAYPWSMRMGAAPAFGDHICRAFDLPGLHRRWALVPGRIAPDMPWRAVRVGRVAPDPDAPFGFVRCMSVRSPNVAVARLVPKSALQEDPELLGMAHEQFGAKPVRAPKTPTTVGIDASVPGRTVVITCMRDEGPFILEWIAYHRLRGVDDFLIYTNDCTDGTDALLQTLAQAGVVHWRANPYESLGIPPQHAALAAAQKERVVARAGWLMSMDVDEFLNIHVGGGHLRDLFAAIGQSNMISCTWRLFGNADQHVFTDEPVTARFTRCAAPMTRKPHQAWGFKTLFRPIGAFKKLGVHRPKGLRPERLQDVAWVNGSGHPMPADMVRSAWRSTHQSVGYDLVTLNHYAVRDPESFLIKRARGRVNHTGRDQGLGYWFRMNNNAQMDTSIQRHLPELKAEIARLMNLPGVAECHAKSVAAYKNRITSLRNDPENAALYAALTSTRMQKLSRMHARFGANVFLAGPDCVPDAIIAGSEDALFTVPRRVETAH